MKATALITRMPDGSEHMMVDTLMPERVLEAWGIHEKQWPGTGRLSEIQAGEHTLRTRVADFHRAMNCPIGTFPKLPFTDSVKLRGSLVAEEAFEFLEAIGATPALLEKAKLLVDQAIAEAEPDELYLPEMVKELADIKYVTEGTNIEFGVDSEPVDAMVHASNMAKLGGPVRDDGKCLKPKGWEPPNIDAELRRQGWEGP